MLDGGGGGWVVGEGPSSRMRTGFPFAKLRFKHQLHGVFVGSWQKLGARSGWTGLSFGAARMGQK